MGIQSPGGIRHILCTGSCALVMGKTDQMSLVEYNRNAGAEVRDVGDPVLNVFD